MEAKGWIIGIGMGFYAYYFPLILKFVYMAALGVLFAKIRSAATGMLFISTVLLMSVNWIYYFVPREYNSLHNFYLNAFTTTCFLVQTISLVLFVRAISRVTVRP